MLNQIEISTEDFNEIYELTFAIRPNKLERQDFEYLIKLREKCLEIKKLSSTNQKIKNKGADE